MAHTLADESRRAASSSPPHAEARAFLRVSWWLEISVTSSSGGSNSASIRARNGRAFAARCRKGQWDDVAEHLEKAAGNAALAAGPGFASLPGGVDDDPI